MLLAAWSDGFSDPWVRMAANIAIGLAILVLAVGPVAVKQFFTKLDKTVEDRVKSFLGRDQAPADAEVAVTAAKSVVDIDRLVRERASALKAACPKADSELRLKWLEAGLAMDAARLDYISTLEKRLDEVLAKVPKPT